MGFGGAGGQKLIVSVAPELMHSATTEEVAEINTSTGTYAAIVHAKSA